MRRRLALLALLCLSVSISIWWSSRNQPHPTGAAVCADCPRFDVSADPAAAAPDAGVRGTDPPPAGAAVAALPIRQEELWRRDVPEPKFAAFREWCARWQAANPTDRAALEPEGVALARERRRALADLIQGRPQRALELAIPQGVARSLPGAVRELLEERVNTRGNYFVAGAMPLPGRADEIAAVTRWAEIDGEKFLSFTYGAGTGFLTRSNIPLNGIALPASAATNPPDRSIVRADQIMALSESPVRQLDGDEVAAAIAASGEVPDCPTSGLDVTANNEPVGTEVGGEEFLYCGKWHAAAASADAVDGLNLSVPGGAAAADPPVLGSPYTQGYKRMLILRVDFPDRVDTGGNVTIGLTAAENLLRDLRTYVRLMSYGTHNLAPVGPGGSAATPVLRLPNNVSAYDDEGLGQLIDDARVAAAAAGYDPDNYDWHGVFTAGSQPAAGYAGLAWVGGVGFHMANGYFSKHVVTHEFGHNLGLPHAHRWDTDEKSIAGFGSIVEYGNRYDPIGATYDSIPGEKHFVGSYKNYIDWIPDTDVTLASGSARYRLTTTDDIHASGRRGLRIPKDTRNYWIEFRQNLNDPVISNGVFLQWANTDGRQSYLLDALPEASGVSLAVGRTFSDPRANSGSGVHVTPVGKGGTFPESMDVQVTVGTPAGNRPPRAVVRAQATAAGVDSPIEFSVEASDPDGDDLAYYWDFGNGVASYNNRPVQTQSFGAAGDYAVQCTVSDMKGGTARDSIVVQVDSVSAIGRISGRVFDVDLLPLSGIRVTATGGSTTRMVHTDSDGIYVIPNLPRASTYTVAAREIVHEGFNFSHPFFTNPVSIATTDFANADFIGSTGPNEIVTPLIAKETMWRYFSTGAAPPSTWKQFAYDDSGWEEGNGVLGYGNEDGQATTVPYGTSSTNKWTSYYFRRGFTVANPAAFTGIRLEVLRDDGVVVYLNGAEVFRDNMPAGTPVFATQASDQTEPGDYIVHDIPITGVVAGTNQIAAEVHQAAPGSSDMAFDMAVSGVAPLAGVGDTLVAVTAPEDNAEYEFPAASIPLAAVARVTTGSVSKVGFFADDVLLGEDASPPYGWSWTNPPAGEHTVKVVATLATNATLTSAPVRVTLTPPPTTLIAADATWKYFAAAGGPPAGWQAPAFVDTSWASGAAQLGYGDGDEATLIPSGGPGFSATYYRGSFTVADPQAIQSLTAHLVRDDGAVVYVNGTEVIRSHMPPGPVTYATLATISAGVTTVENEPVTFPIDPALIVPGRNVVAVEIHQQSASSSDSSFALALEAVATVPRPRGLTLTAPASVTLPDPVVLTADPVAGGSLGIAMVRFFAGGTEIGSDSSAPFGFMWTGATAGSHELTAVATDTAGATIPSNMVTVTVAPPWQSRALVSFGEVWKYFGDGTAPPFNWTARTSFNDAAWPSGRAKLGYGGDGEATLLSYGPEVGAKYISSYFRRKFTVADASAISRLLLRLVRDDGAVVYLNTQEIFRSQMPAGPITPTTLASQAVEGSAESQPVVIELPVTGLVSGENQLAVEVHQASGNSADLGFDLELIGLTTGAPPFYLTNPAHAQQISAAVDFPLSVHIDAGLSVERVEYFAGPAKIGESTAAPFTVIWTTPLRDAYPLTAVATLTGGGTLVTPPISVVVGEAYTSLMLVPSGTSWKYRDDGSAPPAGWTANGFNDTQWLGGPARLGFGGDGEVTALEYGGVGAGGVFRSHLAYYFRRAFTVPATTSLTTVVLRYQRDDGIVIYVNGNEVVRNNIAAGPVTATTLASTSLSGTDETEWIQVTVSPSLLLAGANVVAAEVHQQSDTSSDLGFDLELSAYGIDSSAVANSAPPEPPSIAFGDATGSTGAVEFQVDDDQDGRLYLIEGSDDLSVWTPISYEFVRDGAIGVPIDQTEPHQFYRARWMAGVP